MIAGLSDEEMHALQSELINMFDGLSLEAVLFTCAGLMAHAYSEIIPERRDKIRSSVDKFISRTIKDIDTCGQRAN